MLRHLFVLLISMASVLACGQDRTFSHLPFDPTLAAADATSSGKLVFAHYFLPYPLAIQNVLPEQSYYQRNYLNPHGEKDKFLAQGGLLRERPLLRAPVPEYESFQLTDLRREIRLAKAVGIDGFSLNIMSLSGAQWQQTERMLQAAAEEDFHILIMPDMNAGLRKYPEKFVDLIKYLGKFSSVLRMQDGAIAVAPYLAERQTPEWWQQQKQALEREGVRIALVPVFLDVSGSFGAYRQNWPGKVNDILYGVSGWGARVPTKSSAMAPFYQAARNEGLITMAPVAPQDMRPKSSIFAEAGNSLAYRSLWRSAIENDADWVQIITWNDYSESTEVAPSTLTGYAFYDLTAYYVEWFKHGKPEVVRDAMYAFYRGQRWNAPIAGGKYAPFKMRGGYAPRDEIELLAFLKEPGTLEISINGHTRRMDSAAGMQSFSVPLEEGVPVFRLLRGGRVVSELKGRHSVRSHVEIPNLLYLGEAAARVPSQGAEYLISWPWRYRDFSADMKLLQVPEKSPFPRMTDDMTMLFRDASPTSNSGVGYSFRLSKPVAGDLVISLDMQLSSAGKQTADYEVALTTLTDKALFSLPFRADIEGWCVGIDRRCPVKIVEDRWYRLELRLHTTKSGAPELQVIVEDDSGIRSMLPGRKFDRWSSDVFAIRAVTAGEPRSQGAIYLDNVSITEDRGEGEN